MNIREAIAKAKSSRKNGNKGQEAFLDELAAKGSELIEEAERTRDCGNVSYNLHDAYGYAVYYNGKLMRDGFLKDGVWSKYAHKGYGIYPSGTGREYAADVLDFYKPPIKGYSLIVFNAAFYTSFLEDGVGLLKRKYQVISQIATSAEQYASKVGGKFRKV